MPHSRTSVLVACLAAALTTTTTAADSSALDGQFAEALDLCAKIYLPNTMARPQAFDLESELHRLEAARDAKALGFASPAGVKFLVEKSKLAKDTVAQACGVDLLAALARRGLTQDQ
jgi:hypothetical protein